MAFVYCECVFHQQWLMRISMFRARFVAYAIAALISLGRSVGYSLKIDAFVVPSARLSRTTETMMRVPLIHGFPWQILACTLIRFKRLFLPIRFSSPKIVNKKKPPLSQPVINMFRDESVIIKMGVSRVNTIDLLHLPRRKFFCRV